MEVHTTPGERWEQAIPHHPDSETLIKMIGELDFSIGDHLCLKWGGDGDNGEWWMYLLDILIEEHGVEIKFPTPKRKKP